MLIRTLLDPTPADGGGGTPPLPPPGEPGTSTPPAPPSPETLSLPRAEVERLYGATRLMEELQARAAESQRRQTEAEAMAASAKGQNEQLQKLLADRDAESAKIRDAWLGEAVERTIANKLTGKAWVSESAAIHAARLLRDDLESVLGDDGKPVVRDRKTGRPATDVLEERLSSPEFAHYLKAPGKGGSGAPTPPSRGSDGAASLEEFQFNPFGRPVEGGEGFLGASRRR